MERWWLGWATEGVSHANFRFDLEYRLTSSIVRQLSVGVWSGGVRWAPACYGLLLGSIPLSPVTELMLTDFRGISRMLEADKWLGSDLDTLLSELLLTYSQVQLGDDATQAAWEVAIHSFGFVSY